MNLKEAMASGKRIKRSGDSQMSFGKISEDLKGVIHLEFESDISSTGIVKATLALTDLMADDWVTEAEPRVFWVGMVKYQSPNKVNNVLMAKEQEKCPDYLTADGKPWIKVIETV